MVEYEAMSEEERAQMEGMFVSMIMSDDSGQFADLQMLIASGQQDISVADVVAGLPDEMIKQMYKASHNNQITRNTYELNLRLFGYSKIEVPHMISIYPKDFESKDRLTAIISEYNKSPR